MGLVGRLEDLGISDIFQILGIGKKTGTLVITGSRGTAFIDFSEGAIMMAETSAFEHTLSDDLAASGAVKQTTFKLAQSVKGTLPGKGLFEILIELGAVKKETVEKFARKRIEKVVCEVMQWTEGDFLFELEEDILEGKTELRETSWRLQKGLSPEYLLMEGARVYDESSQGFMPEAGIGSNGGSEEDPSWEDDWSRGAQRKDISSLKALTNELRVPDSASEITLLILRFASEIFQRGVLFMAGPEEIAGLGQFGLDIDMADEKIRQIVLDLRKSKFLCGIINSARPCKGELEKDAVTERLVKELGGGWPPEAAFYPLVAEGRVVALLYCDNQGGSGEPESEGLEIFISQAGMALEKALLVRRLQDLEKGR